MSIPANRTRNSPAAKTDRYVVRGAAAVVEADPVLLQRAGAHRVEIEHRRLIEGPVEHVEHLGGVSACLVLKSRDGRLVMGEIHDPGNPGPTARGAGLGVLL